MEQKDINKAMQILKKHGVHITPEQANLACTWLFKLANIQVNNIKKGK